MSEPLPDFNLVRPHTVEEALAIREACSNSRYCAGGTDLIVNMRRGLVELETLIDLTGIPQLKTTKFNRNGVHIGAGITINALVKDKRIEPEYHAVVEAAGSIAGPNHRETATIGGNLCLDTRCLYYNQSHWWRKSNDYCLKFKGEICHVAPNGNRCRAAYCGDLAPALLVHDAEVVIAGVDGNRQIPLKDLYKEDGAEHLALKAGEILVSIFIPSNSARSSYKKIRIRGEVDFPLAAVAIACRKTGVKRYRYTLAITGTNSMPVKVDPVELEIGRDDPDQYFETLGKLVQQAVSPQRTTTIAPHYRRLSVAALAARTARELLV